MSKEERFDIIGKYLRRELKEDEKMAFEHRLENEQDLKESYNFHKEVHYAIGDQKLHAFKETLAASEQAYFAAEKKSQSTLRIRQYWGAAAAILLVVVSSFLYRWSSTSSDEELFQQYFQAYQAPTTFRNVDVISLDKSFIEGLAKYDRGLYEEAVAHFTVAAERNPDHTIIPFLRGVSQLATGALPAAKADFEQVVADENSLLVEQSKWYLGLLYLRKGDRDGAIQLLEELPNEEEAQELLEKLH